MHAVMVLLPCVICNGATPLRYLQWCYSPALSASVKYFTFLRELLAPKTQIHISYVPGNSFKKFVYKW